MKRFGYLATSDLASEGHGSHFTKLWRDCIKTATRGNKMAMAFTFVERFHRYRVYGYASLRTIMYGTKFPKFKILGGKGGGS